MLENQLLVVTGVVIWRREDGTCEGTMAEQGQMP